MGSYWKDKKISYPKYSLESWFTKDKVILKKKMDSTQQTFTGTEQAMSRILQS